MNNKEKDIAVARFFLPRYLESAKKTFREDSVPEGDSAPEFAIFYCGRYREIAEKVQISLTTKEDTELKLIENSARLLVAIQWWNQAASGDCRDPVMAIQFCSEYLDEAGLSASTMGVTQAEFDSIKQRLGQ